MKPFLVIICVQVIDVSSNVKRFKKSLKIPKRQSDSYIEEEQTTQWPKEKSTKGQTPIYKTYI